MANQLEQEWFDPDDFADRKAALKARRERIRELKTAGYCVLAFTLPNQQRGYSGFGTVRDTSCRNLYGINIGPCD
jgi:hypothetical protein